MEYFSEKLSEKTSPDLMMLEYDRQIFSKLTEKEQEVLKSYTQNDFFDMNEYITKKVAWNIDVAYVDLVKAIKNNKIAKIRKTISKHEVEVKEKIKILKKIVNKGERKIEKDVYLYRGVMTYNLDKKIRFNNKFHIDVSNFKKDEIIGDKRFLSFTLNPEVALRFNDLKPCCIFRLRLKKGDIVKMFHPSNSHFEIEMEYILCGNKFKIEKVWYLTDKDIEDLRIKVYDLVMKY